MKLELKHLAPYLPYGLKGRVDKKSYIQESNERIGELKTIDLADHNYELAVYSELGYFLCDIHEFKPILRPLSDLTKDIEVNSEKIKVHELLEIDSCSIEFINFKNNSFFHNQPVIRTTDCEFIYAIDVYNNIIQELFKYHFDIFGLIEKGLAIDINTLDK